MGIVQASQRGGRGANTSSRLRLLKYLSARLGAIALTFLGLLFVTFLVGRVIPVDPVLALAGDRASPEVYEAIRVKLRLDQPLLMQFLYYLNDALHGDLGNSVLSSKPVTEDIARFFPATIELATVATFIGVLGGLPLGVLAAVRHGRWQDHAVRIFSLAGYSVPVFWLGLMGLILFYAHLGWVGGPGRIDIAYQYSIPLRTGFMLVDTALAGNAAAFGNAFSHIILPASVLGYVSLAFISRMTRTVMINELGQEYIITARAKGLPMRRILWRHALANGAAPLITTIALSYAQLLEGAVLTETVFAWPGLGLYVTQSLFSADLNAVLGATIVIGLCFVLLNGVSDLLYPLFDPRVR